MSFKFSPRLLLCAVTENQFLHALTPWSHNPWSSSLQVYWSVRWVLQITEKSLKLLLSSALSLLPPNQCRELDLLPGWDLGIFEAVNKTLCEISRLSGFADFALGSCCCLKVNWLPCLISSWVSWLTLQNSSWVSNGFIMGYAHTTSLWWSQSLWDVARFSQRPHTIW